MHTHILIDSKGLTPQQTKYCIQARTQDLGWKRGGVVFKLNCLSDTYENTQFSENPC